VTEYTLIESSPEVKHCCYYCDKWTYNLKTFVTHLDWHHYLATVCEHDNRLPYQRIVKETKEKNLFWVYPGKWEDRS
jgi:hypothetical protein